MGLGPNQGHGGGQQTALVILVSNSEQVISRDTERLRKPCQGLDFYRSSLTYQDDHTARVSATMVQRKPQCKEPTMKRGHVTGTTRPRLPPAQRRHGWSVAGVPRAWMRHHLLMVGGRDADEETRRHINTAATGEERTRHDIPDGDHPRLSRRPPARGCHVPPLWGHPNTYTSLHSI